MAQLVRCKSCGYVTEEGKLKDVCPACGVPRKMFEPFTDTISSKRREILDLDIHPIIVHFAISFALSAFVLALSILAFPTLFRATVTGAIRVFGGALPLILIATFFSGRFDARVRFRKARSALLRIKTIVGIAFFLLAAASASLILLVGPFTPWVSIVDAILLAGCVCCAFILGRIGSRLLYALFPG
jgi:uncharacterized membrane protein/rubredoxin